MNIKIKNEEELLDVCRDALHILSNLRHFTKKWNQGHGYELKQRKQYYEEQADKLIERLRVTEHRHPNQVNIQIKS